MKEEFLEPLDMSVYALAKEIRVSRSRINDICLGKHGITANIALRLGKFFDVDPQWFMNMQAKYDLHVESAELAKDWLRSSQEKWHEAGSRPCRQVDRRKFLSGKS